MGILSESLGLQGSTVTDGIHALAQLFTETAKLGMGPARFAEYISHIPLSTEKQEEVGKLLYKVHIEKQESIRAVLGELVEETPGYDDLEWRLDIQVICILYCIAHRSGRWLVDA